MRLSAAHALAMLFLASSTVVDAVLVAFTQPGNSDTSYQAGTTTIVIWKWDNTGNVVDPNAVNGKLYLGKSNANNIVEVLGEVAQLNATALASGKYSWSIPTSLVASDQYSLIMEVGTQGAYYTGKFKIVAAAPLVAFTQPGNSDSSYQAGSTIIVGWKWDDSSNVVDHNTINGTLYLGKSNANNIVQVQGEVAQLDATVLASEEYYWSIPTSLVASDQYSLIMEVGGKSYYTGKFKIVAAAAAPGGTTNSTDSGSKGGDATINKAASLLAIPAVLMGAAGQFLL